jgi:hypothetical protein
VHDQEDREDQRLGRCEATITASANGFWRYVFAGSSTTAAVTSPADEVIVH